MKNHINKIKRFICIGAHSDDIEIRMGGIYSRLIRQGAQGWSVVAIDGPYVRSDFFPPERSITLSSENIQIRWGEAEHAAKILGAENLDFLHLQSRNFYRKMNDNRIFHPGVPPNFSNWSKVKSFLDEFEFTGYPLAQYAKYDPEFMNDFRKSLQELRPDAIFTHSLADRHPDHWAIADMVFQAVTDLNITTTVPVYQWHSGSCGRMTQYCPSCYIELSRDDVDKATKAMQVFESQFSAEVLQHYFRTSASVFGQAGGVEYAQPLHLTHFPTFSATLEPRKYLEEEVAALVATYTEALI